MANKPSYAAARKARGTATMTIESAPKSFVDKDLTPKESPADSTGEKIVSSPAKSIGSISPEPNAPKQASHGDGFTKTDPSGLTKT